VSTTRPAPLTAEDRERLLRAAADRSLGERLLAHLVLGEGLTLAQAVAVRGSDLSDGAVTVTTKTGRRETRDLSRPAAELALRAVQDVAADSMLVTGRSGRPLPTAAAREILLGLARTSGVPVRSVHQLRAERRVVAAA
jgi:integrase